MRTLMIAPLALALAAQEVPTTLKDQKALAVTIYNGNLALVKDTREMRLPKGEAQLAFQEVSAQIRPETALLRNLTEAKGFWVAEQNFDFDLLTPQKLLEKYVGQDVTVIRPGSQPGQPETSEKARVLATNQGTVLQFADRIETSIPGRVVFPSVPASLRARPTLVLNLHSPADKAQKLELSYLTGGLAWKADYVANLSADEKQVDLSGWVTLTNQSGATYPEATLQLVAGDVNRAREDAPRERVMMMAKAAPAPMSAPEMKEEGLFEYHLYTLDRPTTLKENQTKQVALLSASGVPVRKEYLLRAQSYWFQGPWGDPIDKQKVAVYVEFDNKAESRLGMPLPKGIVRVYKRDSEGRAQFVGEDRIDHTPRMETVRLKLGEAFDLTARRRQTDFKALGRVSANRNAFEYAWEVELKNAKKEPVTITVLEPLHGDWEIVQSSHPATKTGAFEARFQVTVPAEGSTTLTYRARSRW